MVWKAATISKKISLKSWLNYVKLIAFSQYKCACIWTCQIQIQPGWAEYLSIYVR